MLGKYACRRWPLGRPAIGYRRRARLLIGQEGEHSMDAAKPDRRGALDWSARFDIVMYYEVRLLYRAYAADARMEAGYGNENVRIAAV